MSDQAQADLDTLVDTVIPYAQQQISEHGGFPPFAASLTLDGQIVMYGADGVPRLVRGAATVLADLYATVRAARGELRAAAFVAAVDDDTDDVIRVELEHSDGAWLTLAMPYSTTRLRKSVTYQPVQSAPAQPHVWTRRPPGDR